MPGVQVESLVESRQTYGSEYDELKRTEQDEAREKYVAARQNAEAAEMRAEVSKSEAADNVRTANAALVAAQQEEVENCILFMNAREARVQVEQTAKSAARVARANGVKVVIAEPLYARALHSSDDDSGYEARKFLERATANGIQRGW